MVALFDPARHEVLARDEWDEEAARAAIAEIAADTEAAFDPVELWPPHPGDLQGVSPPPLTSFYFGAAGVMWALARLADAGLVTPARDWRAELPRLIDRYRARPDTGSRAPSYFLGEVGPLAVAGGDPDEMFGQIESNITNPTLELLWGASGTMLPALWQYRSTGETRWRDLWLANARHLLATWTRHDDAGCYLWTQDLYGEQVRLTGAGHGLVGNLLALLAGRDLLSPEEDAALLERGKAAVMATAIRDGDLANWLPHVGTPRSGREPILVQWCHGAPGVITSFAEMRPDPELDPLLLAGGELTWTAGPLSKGAGLCHGTAGNGYAFLVLHHRTGDARWLDRARRFAVHGIGQWRAARVRDGRGRYSLWTGDLGLALYLADSIAGTGNMPGLDGV